MPPASPQPAPDPRKPRRCRASSRSGRRLGGSRGIFRAWAVLLGLGGALVVGLAAAPCAAGRPNRALLGVVTAPGSPGVRVLHVLESSAAQRAGLQAGDVLLWLGDAPVKVPADVDRALRHRKPGDTIELGWQRGEQEMHARVTLGSLRSYEGSFFAHRGPHAVGFEAPPWFAYAWAHVDADRPPPTRDNTRGKVVVIHAFQSW